MDRETAAELRGQSMRGVVNTVTDTGIVQQIEVQTHEGRTLTGVEVLQQYGIASHAPEGGLVVLLSLGGDQGDQVALPVANPSFRFGGLAAGETVLYDAAGNRVHIKAGGVVEVHAASQILLRAPRVVIEAPDGVQITGDVTVEGTITSTGDQTAGGVSQQHHRHGGVEPGGGNSGEPA
ncbi:phage baseplate assembly protein V [Plastoroseomonas hellenica]|uniref:phage baseplate assembly protein V n=1 Tax=Plastoroseomonas hellenica TaxID=2687306 RepID=UPI001BA94F7B|nr:phage baseplate assembly protein [Plastoroseomonas hellenica]MBR0643982.1 phage baseplate assembly protein V [Plastoroseomonas hellenica]